MRTESTTTAKRMGLAGVRGRGRRHRLAAVLLLAGAGGLWSEEAAPLWPALDSLSPISPANASRIESLAEIGTSVIEDLAWSPGGDFIALRSSSGVAVYQLGTEDGSKLSLLRVIKEKRPPSGISFGSQDEHLAVCDGSKSVKIWEPRSGWIRAEVKDAGGPVRAACLSPVAFLLAAATGDGKLRLWRDQSQNDRQVYGYSTQ